MDEAEIYVRDHLLLQFVMDCYIEDPIEIEELYKEWINWLKYREGKHD